MNRYGHLFSNEMDRLAQRLEAAHRADSRQLWPSWLEAGEGHRTPPAQAGRSEWGGESGTDGVGVNTGSPERGEGP